MSLFQPQFFHCTTTSLYNEPVNHCSIHYAIPGRRLHYGFCVYSPSCQRTCLCSRSQYLTIICSEIFQYFRIGADHFARIHSCPPDVKSWTTFFTNKFEKSQKNKPYKVFSRFRTDLSLVGLNCFLYMILS